MTKRICLIYLSVFIKEREEKRGSDFRWCGREFAIWAEQWKREIGTLPQRARITVYGFRKHSGGRNDGIYQFAQKYAYVSQLAAHTSVQIAARLNRYGKSGRRPGESRSIKNSCLSTRQEFFSAADRNRTGTGITTHGILSPGRRPVPPLRLSLKI